MRFLVAAAEIFGIDSNATRVAITRLLSCGLIERDERGAYRTGSAAAPILDRLGSWRRLDKRTREWDGTWLGATPDASSTAKDPRAASIKALEFIGMREFSPGLWIRPDNMEGGIAAARQALQALHLPEDCPVFTIRNFDQAGEARARSLWDSEAIRAGYRQLAADLARSAAELPNMDEHKAMAESFLLGGEAIRRIVLDPLLPDAIVPTSERDDLVRAMTTYDQVGRSCWAPFLERYGVFATEPPMDRQIWREASQSPAGDFHSINGESA